MLHVTLPECIAKLLEIKLEQHASTQCTGSATNYIRARACFTLYVTQAQIHLLLSGLTIGWNDSSFPFGVHGGLCLKTFNLLNTCQRKRPGKRSISIATRLVFSSLFVHLQHWPQIRHSFYWGNLKQSTGGFFFSIAVPGSFSSSRRCGGEEGLLKGEGADCCAV